MTNAENTASRPPRTGNGPIDRRDPPGGPEAGVQWPGAGPAGGAPVPSVAYDPGDEWRRALTPEDRSLLDAALDAAEEAAEVHLEAAGRAQDMPWGEKSRADFVTAVDLDAERRITAILKARFPEHAILAEEGTENAEDATEVGGPASGAGSASEAAVDLPIRWIIDPLDGTTNWLHGYPEYAVSIAAADGEGIRMGVVLNSATGERFEAVRGEGARRDGEPIHVSPVREIRLALAGTGFPFKKLELLPAYLEVFERVLRVTSGVRRGGSAALDLCDVACGRFDAFWEFWLMPWDVAAGSLILREAGGRFERLPVPGLEDEGDEGAAAAREFASDLPHDLRPGGFLGGAPQLMDEFRRLVSGV